MTPDAAAIPAALFLTLGYAALCAVSPFANCPKCRGFGCKLTTNRRGRLRPGRACRRCRSTGKRLRIGRRVYNLVATLRRDGTR